MYLIEKKIKGDDSLESKTDVHGHFVDVRDNHLKVFTLRKTVKTKIVFSIRNLRNVLMFIRAQCFVLMYHLIRKACL